MKKADKPLLKALEKMVSKKIKREKYGDGPPYCPVIFHQPKRPNSK